MLDFVFPDDPRLLARRYLAVAGLRALWELANLNLPHALLAFLPPTDTPGLLADLTDIGSLAWLLPTFVLLLLSLTQLGLTLGALRLVVLRWRPELVQTQPWLAVRNSTGIDQPIDGKRLQHPWWITPALMTLVIILACYVIAWLFLMFNAGRAFPFGWIFEGGTVASLLPLTIGLALGIVGAISGGRFMLGAKASVGRLASVSYVGDDHWLAGRVHALADRLELPRPTVGIMPARNAFAMGSDRRKAVVVIGQPLINELTAAELDAVIGHELGHIVSNDMQSMQFAGGYQEMFGGGIRAATKVGAGVARKQNDAMLVVAISTLLHRTVLLGSELLMMLKSRSREYYADAIGAALTSPARHARRAGKGAPDYPLRQPGRDPLWLSDAARWLPIQPAVLDTSDLRAAAERPAVGIASQGAATKEKLRRSAFSRNGGPLP